MGSTATYLAYGGIERERAHGEDLADGYYGVADQEHLDLPGASVSHCTAQCPACVFSPYLRPTAARFLSDRINRKTQITMARKAKRIEPNDCQSPASGQRLQLTHT